jgi:hypothetical protein
VERRAKLASGSDEMRREIVERRYIKAHLLENEAPLYRSLLSAADRASAEPPDTNEVSKQMLRRISPIGESSPVKAQLSPEWSSA